MSDTIQTFAAQRGRIDKPTLLLTQILAGRSVLTVRSRKTNERFTFSFRRPQSDFEGSFSSADDPRPIFVSQRTGGDDHNWAFIGTMFVVDAQGCIVRPWMLKPSKKTKVDFDSTAAHAARWIAAHLPGAPDVLMEQAEWWHEGACGRCGRQLTVPESIETGFGPECRKAVGL